MKNLRRIVETSVCTFSKNSYILSNVFTKCDLTCLFWELSVIFFVIIKIKVYLIFVHNPNFLV